MEFTNEMIKKAQKAASAEELIQIAKAEGISLSAEDAEKYFSFLHESKELTEDELEAVSGGELDGKGKKETPDPKYHVGQSLWLGFYSTRTFVGIVILEIEFYLESDGWRYLYRTDYGYEESGYLDSKEYVFTYKPSAWPD